MNYVVQLETVFKGLPFCRHVTPSSAAGSGTDLLKSLQLPGHSFPPVSDLAAAAQAEEVV